MRRVLLISLSLVLALAGWSTVCADAYAQPVGKKCVVIPLFGNSPATVPAPVPKTGQTTSYGTRDDGALQKGVAWPTPRFTDNNNGTVTDNLTKLIWMKNANAFGERTWDTALSDANNLKSGDHGLTDGSQAGDWRLPNRRELLSLVDDGKISPALPAGHPFTSEQSDIYWSSSSYLNGANGAWIVNFADGIVLPSLKTSAQYVWCVRGGP
ncbi:MAG: DUF1566 domain-containing protein [Thermodesulfobacteriota bacterium]